MTEGGKKWLRILGMAVAVAGVLWLAKEQIAMELSWRAPDENSTQVEDIRRDLAEGRTGLQPLEFPCVTNLEKVDLDLTIKGPMPALSGSDVVMSVRIGQRVYLGPPIRHIRVADFPVCRETTDPPDLLEEALWEYVLVYFTDMSSGRSMGFSGEQAFPLALWRTVEIELLPIPTRVTDGVITQIIVRPTDPAAPYPDTLRNLR